MKMHTLGHDFVPVPIHAGGLRYHGMAPLISHIYELGLIYDVAISEDGDATVTMTLTTPHCPVAESLPNEVELRVLSVPGIRDSIVNVVWDPPWDPQKMTDDAKLELGML